MATHRGEILEQVNFTSPYATFPFRLTVLENLKVFARIYNLKKPRERIDQLLERFGITKLRDKERFRGCRRARIRGSGCARRS